MNPPPPPKRSDVLFAIWNRAKWLDETINSVELNKRKVTPKLKQQIYMAQVYNQLCKTVIYGLKEEELELRIKELEESLNTGILIPLEAKNHR